MSRSNLRVVTDAHATRILLQSGRATGVEFASNAGVMRAEASEEVVVCAGAIQSPQLLQLSGIGPEDVLRRAGVPVNVALAGVGRNLQDHLQFRPVFRAKGAYTLNDLARSRFDQAREFFRYLVKGQGHLANGIFRAGGFFCSSQAPQGWPDAQIHFALLSYERPDLGPHPFPGVMLSACLLRPESRGFVEIVSSDPKQHPKIEANYLSTQRDRELAVELVQRMLDIGARTPLADFIERPHEPGVWKPTKHALNEWVARKASSIFHPAGTCAMGPNPGQGHVVDASLRVHGVSGLRVADASIMPTIVSGNTNAPTVMIGERAAELIRNGAAASPRATDGYGPQGPATFSGQSISGRPETRSKTGSFSR